MNKLWIGLVLIVMILPPVSAYSRNDPVIPEIEPNDYFESAPHISPGRYEGSVSDDLFGTHDQDYYKIIIPEDHKIMFWFDCIDSGDMSVKFYYLDGNEFGSLYCRAQSSNPEDYDEWINDKHTNLTLIFRIYNDGEYQFEFDYTYQLPPTPPPSEHEPNDTLYSAEHFSNYYITGKVTGTYDVTDIEIIDSDFFYINVSDNSKIIINVTKTGGDINTPVFIELFDEEMNRIMNEEIYVTAIGEDNTIIWNNRNNQVMKLFIHVYGNGYYSIQHHSEKTEHSSIIDNVKDNFSLDICDLFFILILSIIILMAIIVDIFVRIFIKGKKKKRSVNKHKGKEKS